jgi:hypothetical protein
VYQSKGREGNISWNPSSLLIANKTKNNRYGGIKYTALINTNNRVNASCEKLPRTRLIANDKDKHSNSIIIRKNDTSIVTPQKPYINVDNTNILRNKSNISHYEGHREDLLDPANPMVVSRLMPKSIYQKDLNKTNIDGDRVTFKDWRNSLNVLGKNPSIVHNTSSNNRFPRENESTTLSGLSMGDEWTEIELYNGILSKMRKDHEIASKRNKIQEIRNTLRDQITQQKEVKKKELEEKREI